jgi:hypothetical protein
VNTKYVLSDRVYLDATHTKLITLIEILEVVVIYQIVNKIWCWGSSASEGPQKHDLTMFFGVKYINRYLRTRIRATVGRSTRNMKVYAEPKLCAEELQENGRKGNRLKDEKPD